MSPGRNKKKTGLIELRKADCARPKRHEEGVTWSTGCTLLKCVEGGAWGWGQMDRTRLEKRVAQETGFIHTHKNNKNLLTVGSDAHEQDVTLSERRRWSLVEDKWTMT